MSRAFKFLWREAAKRPSARDTSSPAPGAIAQEAPRLLLRLLLRGLLRGLLGSLLGLLASLLRYLLGLRLLRCLLGGLLGRRLLLSFLSGLLGSLLGLLRRLLGGLCRRRCSDHHHGLFGDHLIIIRRGEDAGGFQLIFLVGKIIDLTVVQVTRLPKGIAVTHCVHPEHFIHPIASSGLPLLMISFAFFAEQMEPSS